MTSHERGTADEFKRLDGPLCRVGLLRRSPGASARFESEWNLCLFLGWKQGVKEEMKAPRGFESPHSAGPYETACHFKLTSNQLGVCLPESRMSQPVWTWKAPPPP